MVFVLRLWEYNDKKELGVITMEFDTSKPICRYFNEMLQIPHGSFNEQAISDWVVSFAKEHNLRYIQDEMGNVLVYKPATAGYEGHGAVILQAHLDMVCEKLEEVEHDFTKDAIKTEVIDGWLHAKGTTLGADDGTGVSYMMAILAENTLKHPALECVFTVQEETGLTGAMNLKKEYFEAKRMINLDCGADGTTMTTTAGGIAVSLHENYIMEEENKTGYRLRISGLLGGHSGGNINKERANANKLAGRVLYRFLKQGLDVQLVEIHGGNKDNAIPRDCTVTFASLSSMEELKEVVEAVENEVKKEYAVSDPDISIVLSAKEAESKMMTEDESISLIQFLMILPNGLQAASMEIKDLPMASMNLASISLEGGECILRYSLRSALDSWLEEMTNRLQCCSDKFGFKMSTSNHYPAWAYRSDSTLREIFAKVYYDLTKSELKMGASHGGTECGVFCQLIEDIDIVTCAPLASGAHTPQECLNLEAFDKTYTILTTLLENL